MQGKLEPKKRGSQWNEQFSSFQFLAVLVLKQEIECQFFLVGGGLLFDVLKDSYIYISL